MDFTVLWLLVFHRDCGNTGTQIKEALDSACNRTKGLIQTPTQEAIGYGKRDPGAMTIG